MRDPRRRQHEAYTITRREAARRLLGLPALAASCGLLAGPWSSRRRGHPASVAAPTPPVFRGYVAGFQFHDGPELVDGMAPGESVTFVREPENRHDRHAVRIDYAGRKLGYVPRSVSEHVAHVMAERSSVPGVISAVDPEAVPWRAVQVRARV